MPLELDTGCRPRVDWLHTTILGNNNDAFHQNYFTTVVGENTSPKELV